MRIAIQNLHRAGITGNRMHNYIVELVKRGHITHLFFDKYDLRDDMLRQIRRQYGWKDLGLDKVKPIFSLQELQSQCDVLLNFNSLSTELTEATKAFKGLKIVHTMDYFWSEPGSSKNKRLRECGVDYLMNYGSPDKYSPYFQKYFPDYTGKIIPVPFGFAPRFVNTTPFTERKHKCLALGSVRPLRFDYESPEKYLEVAEFHKPEEWFHKFRRMLVEERDHLKEVMDSMLPVFPQYRDYDYDMVAKLNEYQMFVSDESIFYFPSAKAFEGPAAGAVQVCSDHPCFSDFGFMDGANCVMHKEFNVEDFREKTLWYLGHQGELARIAEAGTSFVTNRYSHPHIADKLAQIVSIVADRKPGTEPVYEWSYGIWTKDANAVQTHPIPMIPKLDGKTRLLNNLCYNYAGFCYRLVMETRFFTGRVVRKFKSMLASA